MPCSSAAMGDTGICYIPMPPHGSVGIHVQECHVPTPVRHGTTLLSMCLSFHKAAKLTKGHCGHTCLCVCHVLVLSHGDVCVQLSTCCISAPLPGAVYLLLHTNVWAGTTGIQSTWFCSTPVHTHAVPMPLHYSASSPFFFFTGFLCIVLAILELTL